MTIFLIWKFTKLKWSEVILIPRLMKNRFAYTKGDVGKGTKIYELWN